MSYETRKRFRYQCIATGPGGVQQEETFETYWSPQKVTVDEIMLAGSAMLTANATRGRPRVVRWLVVSAKLINPD